MNMKSMIRSNKVNIYKFKSQYFDFCVKGLRELWSLKEGVNPSGSPVRFSSLMDVINGKKLYIDGWMVNKESNIGEEDLLKSYRYTLYHKERNIYIYTNNLNRFVGWLNGFTYNGVARRVTCFREVMNDSSKSTLDGWLCIDRKVKELA